MAAGSLTLITGGGSPAGAHVSESRITLSVDDHSVRKNQSVIFYGKLRNAHRKCRAGEEVQLKRVRTGVIATDVTDSDGEFRFKLDPQPNRGKFFARYRGKGRFGYGNKHKCSAAQSDIVRIRRARR